MAKEKPTTKLCKHCKTEIPYGAKVCPQCRKKQKMGLIPKIIIVLIVIVALGSCFGSDDTDDVDDSNPNASNTPDATQEADNIVTIGSTFTVDDLKITINDADADFTDYEDDYGWYAPADGMKYIMVSFTFENIGESGDKYVSIYDFNCYADNVSCEQVYSLDDSNFINTNLSAGRSVSFKTYYTVPSNSESIELEYEENIWTGDKIVITIQ